MSSTCRHRWMCSCYFQWHTPVWPSGEVFQHKWGLLVHMSKWLHQLWKWKYPMFKWVLCIHIIFLFVDRWKHHSYHSYILTPLVAPLQFSTQQQIGASWKSCWLKSLKNIHLFLQFIWLGMFWCQCRHASTDVREKSFLICLFFICN